MGAGLLLLSNSHGFAIGAAGDTEWPTGAKLDLRLSLKAVLNTPGSPEVRGELIVTNPGDSAVTVQRLSNRLVLAFLVFDDLGNPVPPQGIAKVDPGFETFPIESHGNHQFLIHSLNFVTGSCEQGYKLTPGRTYRVIAVYRPAGPHGPGFTSPETELKVPVVPD